MYAKKPDTVHERVSLIAQMMRELRWKRGKTSKILAEAWDMPVGTVEGYASEASRRVRSEITDPDYVSGKVSLALEMVVDAGAEVLRDGAETMTPEQAARVITHAGRVWSEITGATAPQRVRVEVSPTALSEPELRAQAVEALRVLKGADPEIAEALAKETGDDEGRG